jgi:hypothetical protein
MALWDKLKTELDRAGKVAQDALDEGKLRLEAFRARQLADKAAESLGYAVFRARQAGQDVDWETLQRLVNALAEREAEVKRLEEQIRTVKAREASSGKGEAGAGPQPPKSESTSPPGNEGAGTGG